MTCHFYYILVTQVVPALFGWGSLQSIGSAEVLVVFLNIVFQCLIAWLTNREDRLGHAWAYLVRQYVFFYAIWIPIGTLYTLNNVNAWEGSREVPKKDSKKESVDFFAPAYEQLQDITLEDKQKEYVALTAELVKIQSSRGLSTSTLGIPPRQNSRSSTGTVLASGSDQSLLSSASSVYSSAAAYNIRRHSKPRKQAIAEMPPFSGMYPPTYAYSMMPYYQHAMYPMQFQPSVHPYGPQMMHPPNYPHSPSRSFHRDATIERHAVDEVRRNLSRSVSQSPAHHHFSNAPTCSLPSDRVLVPTGITPKASLSDELRCRSK